MLVRGRVTGLVNAGINGAAHVLEEGACRGGRRFSLISKSRCRVALTFIARFPLFCPRGGSTGRH